MAVKRFTATLNCELCILASHRLQPKVSAYGEGTKEILFCDPEGRRALLRIPSTEGRSVCLCWAKSKPQGPKELEEPKGPKGAHMGSTPKGLFDTIMGLIEADLGSWCVCERDPPD